MSYKPLQMTAEDRDDLQVMAACLQDALIPLSGIEYDRTSGHFHLIANRFCWECEPENIKGTPYHARVSTGVAFHHVKDVHKKGLDLQKKNKLINLLTIRHEANGCIYLIFSGETEIKLIVEKLSCHLKDMDEPYPTANRPDHL